MHSHPRFAEVFATARITAFNPGQSPPPVTTPIRLLMRSFYCLGGQPGVPVFADERDAFLYRVYAMRNFEIDLAREFVTFVKHRAPSPFNELGPHFPHENQGRVVKFAALEELPCERQLQERSDTAGNDNECVRHDHEMMKSGEKRSMFVRLADEWVHFLFEWQRNADTNRTLQGLWLTRMRSFVCCLHQTGAAAADDITSQFC